MAASVLSSAAERAHLPAWLRLSIYQPYRDSDSTSLMRTIAPTLDCVNEDKILHQPSPAQRWRVHVRTASKYRQKRAHA